jgi:hypothetical protein
VQRMNLAWFCQMGAALQQLANPLGGFPHKREELFPATLNVRSYLELLLRNANTESFPLSIRTSYAKIQEFANLIDQFLSEDTSKLDDHQLQHYAIQIWQKATEVETILHAELAIQPTYLLFRKRAFDIETLLADGTRLFSDLCRSNFTDDEKYDINQATKCLVFEVPTAAAFHILRATESVIRRYYEKVVGNLPKIKSRNWGTYLVMLRRCRADHRVLAVLEEMKDLYRNPIIHPESRMEMDEALSLIGIAETAISAMIADLLKRALAAQKAATRAAIAAARPVTAGSKSH